MANLIVILDPESETVTTTMPFLCEEEIMQKLMDEADVMDNIHEGSASDVLQFKYKFQQPLAIIWDDHNDNRNWYIGLYMNDVEENEEYFRIDHLERVGESDQIWQRPKVDDVQEVHNSQIVPCDIEGDWDFNGRLFRFILTNSADIISIFNDNI